MQIVLGIGSNQGDKTGYINRSIQLLEERLGTLISRSSDYETEPWGFVSPDTFVNIVAVFQSTLPVDQALDVCLDIEQELGRVRIQSEQRYSSRTIDIDILFYENEVIETNRLSIPHPLISYRSFVLDPLREVLPTFVHPVLQQAISDITLQTP